MEDMMKDPKAGPEKGGLLRFLSLEPDGLPPEKAKRCEGPWEIFKQTNEMILAPNTTLTVTKEQEPAPNSGIPQGQCRYCRAPTGQEHAPDCVTVQKIVMVRATIEYPIEVPRSWNKDDIEFHRNKSSWCCDNMVDELKKLLDKKPGRCTLCPHTRFQFLREANQEDVDNFHPKPGTGHKV